MIKCYNVFVGASIYGALDHAPNKHATQTTIPDQSIRPSGFYIISDCTSVPKGAINGRPYRII